DGQRAEFRLALRGGNERGVVEFLELVSGELAAVPGENRRLQEHGGPSLASFGGADATWASREAEGILERARADAASIVSEAEARAAAILGGAGACAAGYRGEIAHSLICERDCVLIL